MRRFLRNSEKRTDCSNTSILYIRMVRHFQHIGPIHPTQYLHDDDDLLVNVCVGRVLQKPISRVIYAIYTIQWETAGGAQSCSHIFVLFLNYFGTAKSMWSTKTMRCLRYDCWVPEIVGFSIPDHIMHSRTENLHYEMLSILRRRTTLIGASNVVWISVYISVVYICNGFWWVLPSVSELSVPKSFRTRRPHRQRTA